MDWRIVIQRFNDNNHNNNNDAADDNNKQKMPIIIIIIIVLLLKIYYNTITVISRGWRERETGLCLDVEWRINIVF